MTITPTSASAAGWFRSQDGNLEDFKELISIPTRLEDYPYADAVEQNVLIYGPRLHAYLENRAERADVQAELARALITGPGIVVFKGAFPDLEVVDRATEAFNRLISEQRSTGITGGDHFAKPGANDRLWGALDKLALADPEVFADYYASDILALVSEAWLGPNYQVTSQVNVVNPGGSAQRAHRDYHLGFMSAAQAAAYPAHVHLLTPALTLQGAVAHCDMPLESGPTLYLPHSHKFAPGFVAFHREDFSDYFQANHAQLPLAKGDAAFFNPALFHGAGTNVSTSIKRMANLLQVSSAFGRAMETVDRTAISKALYPVLLGLKTAGSPQSELNNIISASAEGYAFPTNLDLDQPIGGLAPQSQAELVSEYLQRSAPPEELNHALDAQGSRRMTEAK